MLLYLKTDGRHARGFSLIELMIVVSIMATIIALGLVNFNHFKHKAYDVEAESNIRSAIKVLHALDVNDDYPSVNFEIANAEVLTDADNFAPQFPKITDNPKGVYLYILKVGKDVNIISFQCHGTKKFLYDSMAGEYLVTTTELTPVDLSTKCASVI